MQTHTASLKVSVCLFVKIRKPTIVDPNGQDYCSCVPFYQGEECKDMVCLNGGTQVEQRCICPPGFLGYHCEIDTNRTAANSRYLKYDDQVGNVFLISSLSISKKIVQKEIT